MRRRSNRSGAALALLAVAITAATPAEAHIIATRLGDFYAGALHPATDLYDVILWLALGLLAGSLGADRSRWLVILFPLGLATGFWLATESGSFAGDALSGAAWTCLLGLLLVLPGSAADILAVVRPQRSQAVDFRREVLPLLQANCLPCHNKTTTKARSEEHTSELQSH